MGPAAAARPHSFLLRQSVVSIDDVPFWSLCLASNYRTTQFLAILRHLRVTIIKSSETNLPPLQDALDGTHQIDIAGIGQRNTQHQQHKDWQTPQTRALYSTANPAMKHLRHLVVCSTAALGKRLAKVSRMTTLAPSARPQDDMVWNMT